MSLNELLNPAGDPLDIEVNSVIANAVYDNSIIGSLDSFAGGTFTPLVSSIVNFTFTYAATPASVTFNIPSAASLAAFIASKGIVLTSSSAVSISFFLVNTSAGGNINITANAGTSIIGASTIAPGGHGAMVQLIIRPTSTFAMILSTA